MSDTTHHPIEIVSPEAFQSPKLPILQTALGILWVPSFIVAVLGFAVNTEHFAFSWLFSCVFFFTLIAGSYFWILVHYTTDAAWSTVVRRQLENVATLFPWLMLFFIPLPFLANKIWFWTTISPGEDAILAAKSSWYLNKTFALSRSVLVFAILGLWSFKLRQLSIRQDNDGDPKWTVQSRVWAFTGLPLFGISLTMSMVDWLMALDHTWFSTMWGVYLFAGAAWSSMALLIVIITLIRRCGHLQKTVTLEHYHIMGKLLFAFTIFWAYIGFSQYMLIWYANIPEETSYFLRRNTENWHIVSTLLVISHFVIPFLLLLPKNIPALPFLSKKNPDYLALVGAYILCVQALDIYLIVMPNLHPFGPALIWIWIDAACFCTIGIPLALIYCKEMKKLSLLPARDPRVIESIGLTN